jgi:glycerol-3-phosphate dehydrogenase (NAD(P)+)
MRISILGAGSWGSALAIAMSKVAVVQLWSRNSQQVDLINTTRSNPNYLPAEIRFPDSCSASSKLSECLAADLIIVATPLNAVRGLLEQIGAITPHLPDMLLVSKGFEASSGNLPHQIVNEVLPGFARFGVLIGPSFAKEVALGLPTAITLAAADLNFALGWIGRLQQIPNFRIYAHDDVIGAEVGAAIKNVLAIAVGISDGLQLGYNARAALITRSLNELASLVLALGGKRETIYGLTGVGDLILTCTGDLSRNRQVGQELAKKRAITEIITSLGHVAEGVSTAREIQQIANRLGIDMPIVTAVYRIIYENAEIKSEVFKLLNRQPKAEF